MGDRKPCPTCGLTGFCNLAVPHPKPTMRYPEPRKPDCPAWADGEHCYEAHSSWKHCRCGKTVELAPKKEGENG